VGTGNALRTELNRSAQKRKIGKKNKGQTPREEGQKIQLEVDGGPACQKRETRTEVQKNLGEIQILKEGVEKNVERR